MVDVNEIDSLLLEWECGTLDDQGFERLRTLLKTNSTARSRFIQMLLLTTVLYLEADTGATEINTNIASVGATVIPAAQQRFRQTRS